MDFYPSDYLVHVKLLLFLYQQGLTLLELAAHLEGKAPQLRHEGLGKIKIALTGTDSSSLLEILEGCLENMWIWILPGLLSPLRRPKRKQWLKRKP